MKNSASPKTGARSPGARRFLRALPAAAILLPLLAISGCGLFGGDDEGDPTFPIQPPPPTMPWLFDVYGTAADRVFVGGNSGVMYRYDGTDWLLEPTGTGNAITCIWGTGDGVLYACGHGGLIMRNTGGGWSIMSSGTEEDLFALGSYQGRIHAVGRNGAARRLSGSTWEGIPTTMVIRNPLAGNAASDTLDMRADIASLLTVNHYFIGGAYRLPDYEGEEIGRNGTDGMVLGEDMPPTGQPKFDWELRPLGGDEIALSEWVYATTSDDLLLANNYLGTSEGWLFRLIVDIDRPDRKIWQKADIRITTDRNTGIRDMWLDPDGDLYMVTDGGRIVYRSGDAERNEGGIEIYDQLDALVGIWGASADEFWVTGYMSEKILRCSYDPVAGVATVTPVTGLVFPE